MKTPWRIYRLTLYDIMTTDIKKLADAMTSGDESKIAEALGFNADGSALEPTPLTDKEEFYDYHNHKVVYSDFARELERKLTFARNLFLDISRDCEKMQELLNKL